MVALMLNTLPLAIVRVPVIIPLVFTHLVFICCTAAAQSTTGWERGWLMRGSSETVGLVCGCVPILSPISLDLGPISIHLGPISLDFCPTNIAPYVMDFSNGAASR